jgi:hypothetical protein
MTQSDRAYTEGNPTRGSTKAAYTHRSDAVRVHADDYPTPPGFVWPLLDHLQLPPETRVWDPCAGGGHLVNSLRQRFDTVLFQDLLYSGDDFLTRPPPAVWGEYADWIVTNPPYKHADDFIHQALSQVSNVAMLFNAGFLEGIRRIEGLFTEEPPSQVLLCMRKMKLSDGRQSVFAHVWVVWELNHEGPIRWDWLRNKHDLQMPTGYRTDVWPEGAKEDADVE